jgi:hypothetical protein
MKPDKTSRVDSRGIIHTYPAIITKIFPDRVSARFCVEALKEAFLKHEALEIF